MTRGLQNEAIPIDTQVKMPNFSDQRWFCVSIFKAFITLVEISRTLGHFDQKHRKTWVSELDLSGILYLQCQYLLQHFLSYYLTNHTACLVVQPMLSEYSTGCGYVGCEHTICGYSPLTKHWQRCQCLVRREIFHSLVQVRSFTLLNSYSSTPCFET